MKMLLDRLSLLLCVDSDTLSIQVSYTVVMLSITLIHLLEEGQMFLWREGSFLHRFILKHPRDVVMNMGELVSSNSCSKCCACMYACQHKNCVRY